MSDLSIFIKTCILFCDLHKIRLAPALPERKYEYCTAYVGESLCVTYRDVSLGSRDVGEHVGDFVVDFVVDWAIMSVTCAGGKVSVRVCARARSNESSLFGLV